MEIDRMRMGFHLMPPTGWLNDPNGLCQFRGVYHVFYQYSPDWPAPDAPRGWGHATSVDLVRWTHHGMAIRPDTADETSGSYSGCAAIVPGAAADGGDLLRLYYTGNVKEPGDFDYVTEGRRATQILVESNDGFALGPKRPLLREDDYPACCTRHVRDPNVWRDPDGSWWMLLGVRDVDDYGFVLVMHSDDGIFWTHAGEARADTPFGFMWECPDRIVLDGHVYLSCCPQGVGERPWANGVDDQACYFELADGVDLGCGTTPVQTDRAHRWDVGFDFYAPQTFVDDAGRTLLIGWMGVPRAPYTGAPGNMTWCHCLTVPRLLTRCPDGRIAQQPVPELKALRQGAVEQEDDGVLHLPEHRGDIEIDDIEGPFSITLDDAFTLSFDGTTLSAHFSDVAGVGAGRTQRTWSVDRLDNLRLLIDNSAIEVFANDGRAALATRWFPVRDELTVALSGSAHTVRAWRMGSGM